MNSDTGLPAKLKGVGDGLRVTIDPEEPAERLQAALTKIFERLGHLAVNARVTVDTDGTDCPDALVKELGAFLQEKFSVGHVSKPLENKMSEGREPIRTRDMGNAWHHYRSEALIIAGRVRSGQKISARKHLIILGDLNPGAEAAAGGDILVMGSLSGKARAGQPDNEEAIILALQFRPTQVQIGGIVAAGGMSSEGSGRPEFARVEDQAVVVSSYPDNSPFKNLPWPEVR